jgi:hypothetical protein
MVFYLLINLLMSRHLIMTCLVMPIATSVDVLQRSCQSSARSTTKSVRGFTGNIGVIECAPASLPPASSSLTHTRRMDGFCNQNADQLGSLAGLSFPVVYVGVVECAPASWCVGVGVGLYVCVCVWALCVGVGVGLYVCVCVCKRKKESNAQNLDFCIM